MAVVLSIPSQQYTPRTITSTPNIPAGVKRLRIGLTREDWPPGPIGSITVTMPNGDGAGGITFEGGPLFTDAGGKRLSPVAIPGVLEIPLAETYFEFRHTADMPVGQYTFTATILQTMRTALTIERF